MNNLSLKAWIKERRSILKQIYKSNIGLNYSSFYCLCIEMYQEELKLNRSDRNFIDLQIKLINSAKHSIFLKRAKQKKEVIKELKEILFLKIVKNRVLIFDAKNNINNTLNKYT